MNDNAPIFTFSGPFVVEENSAAGTAIGTVSATDGDIDPADVVTFTEASGGQGSATFSIDPLTGVIVVEDPAALDRESTEFVLYDIVATDGALETAVTVTVDITGINDNAPAFTGSGPFSVEENSPAGSTVGAVLAADDDVSPADTLTFSEVSGGAGETTFTIDALTGEITIEDASALDRESVASLLYDIQVTDGVFDVAVTVTVNLVGVNDNAPAFTASGPFAVDESSGAGTSVGSVTAADADVDSISALTFAETPGGAGEATFTIDPATGEITVEDASILDREALDSVLYDVLVTDGVFTASVTVTVNLNGVNDNAPAFDFTGPFAIDENSAAGTSVGTVTATDLDVAPADSLIFAEVSGGAGESTFAIDPSTGAITVQDPAALDRESAESLLYDIQVTDGTFTATVSVEVALNSVNDNAPYFTAAGPFSVDEDSAVGTTVGAVAAADDDVDPADTLAFSEIPGGAGETALDIDPVTGAITVEDPAAFDREIAESVLYDIQVTDGSSTTSVTVTVEILGVNDNPPVFDFAGPF
ncbi:MAG TPA: cadherin repeat domain-containing protein, partial [candidate division Zixibacteria bacterium]|nr:cadherin repeat domain-containing protein [candidate division Zixibacteria bacterium]